MNTGKYVFSQVLSFVSRYEFDRCVSRYNGNYRVREFDCWNMFVQLLFGQLTSLYSLSDICLCLSAHRSKLYHLGIKQNVNKSTLSRANESRDWRIFRDYGYYLISIVRPLYADQKIEGLDINNTIYALDSTTISVSITLLSWAKGKYSRGGVKVHTLLDLHGNIPTFIHVTDAAYHDSNALNFIAYLPSEIYVMDKAYFDLVALFRMETSGAYFVTRPKKKFSYNVLEIRLDYDSELGVQEDITIELKVNLSKKRYPRNMRQITYWDKEKDETFVFVTNNFNLSAIDIANIYRKRWQIEVFFKWIKQNLTIKHLWGHSENAVHIHIWVAISAYLLAAYVKIQTGSKLSVYEVRQIIGVSVFDKTNIVELLTKNEIFTENETSNQEVKEPYPSLFD